MVARTIRVVLKAKTTSSFFRAYLDERRLRFEDGQAVLDLEPKDTDHVLTWFVRDAPGVNYGIQVAAPERAKMKYTATLDVTGKDAGIYWFKL